VIFLSDFLLFERPDIPTCPQLNTALSTNMYRDSSTTRRKTNNRSILTSTRRRKGRKGGVMNNGQPGKGACAPSIIHHHSSGCKRKTKGRTLELSVDLLKPQYTGSK